MKKARIIVAIILLMAGLAVADDPNSMPNPKKNSATWCVDEAHSTFTLRIDMSSKDRWYLAQSEMFRNELAAWVSRIPKMIEDLKKLGAIKWMNTRTLEQTEAERKR